MTKVRQIALVAASGSALLAVVVVVGVRWPAQVGAGVLTLALLWLCRLAYTSSFPPKELQLSDEAELELRRKLQEVAKRRKAS